MLCKVPSSHPAKFAAGSLGPQQILVAYCEALTYMIEQAMHWQAESQEQMDSHPIIII